VKRTLETPEPQDYPVEPIKLEDSLASLKLTSDPPGARILLNGEARGVTPAQIDGICSGKVRVEVKHTAGKFIKDLVLEKDESVSLDCPIRPTLAFIGVEAANAAGLRYLPTPTRRSRRTCSRLGSLNFITAPREAVDRMLEQDKLTRQALLPGSGSDPDLVRKVTLRMATSLEVQGFLVAVLPEERLQRTARLHLLAAGNTKAEAVDVAFADAPAYDPLIKRLDAVFRSERPWSGLVTVDTLLHEGVPVLRVVPGSAAEKAGVAAGRPGARRGRPGGQADRGPPGRGRREEGRRPAGAAAAPCRSRLAAARRRARARLERARDPALRPRPRLQQGDDGPARRGRGLPGQRGGRLRRG
jgi:hypothetical protein